VLVGACAALGCFAGAPATSAAPAVRFPSYGRARVLGVVNHADHEVALSFDDCSNVAAWRSIVATLHRRGRKAAFFCLGVAVRSHPTVSRRVLRIGSRLCNHSWSHPDLTTLGTEAIKRQLRRTRDMLYTVARSRCRFMRPPYGSYDRRVLRIAGRLGYHDAVLWTVDPRDWQEPGAGVITSRVVSAAHPGSIVLLHVLPQTAAALPAILKGLAKKGLTVVPLSTMVRKGDPSRGGWPPHAQTG